MGSCVSKKSSRAGAAVAKEAAPLRQPEKEVPPPPPPVVVEEEVKEVLSETAVPASRTRPAPEPDDKEMVKRTPIDRRKEEEEEEEEASESSSVAAEKTKAKAKGGGDQEVEQQTKVVRAARRRTPEKRKPTNKEGNGRTRSPSPRRQLGQAGGEHPAPPRPPRREQQAPAVSGIGCRSGRFSPSAARRAAESAAVRRTNSARMDGSDMTSAKRSLNGGGAAKRGDAGERSGRRAESPTSKRSSIPPTSPAANGSVIHRQASFNGGSATRKAAAVEQTKPRCKARDGSDESGLEDKQAAAAAEGGALGQNPSVAMECFIFL
uniref:Uncharacterized protein n=1 Tax=Leersia perrieri TaxID=77586 RepID=A0A0D9VVX4_9ORYZ